MWVTFSLFFKEITKICRKKSSEVPKAYKGDYFSPNETGGIHSSILVLEGMFRFCIIPRCQMFRKTLLLKSQLINNLLPHVLYIFEICAVLVKQTVITGDL